MNTAYDIFLPLVLPTGAGAVSNHITKTEFQDAIAIGIYAPTSITDAITFSFQVTDQYDEATFSSWVWRILQSGDPLADVILPIAGKARIYLELPLVGAFRIKATGTVTVQTTWATSKLWGSR